MEISTRYEPKNTEHKWYQHWLDNKYFESTPDDREAYTIVMPPPNVTGILHMGHMLNYTIQDILIRKARMQGFNACWIPGTDHASIATEAKVVRMLREQGIKKSDLSREAFLKHAWDWTDKYGGIILKQFRRLGVSADWNRTRFTMEDSLSEAVIETFIDLHKKGKIYRDYRMIHWDPVAKTVLSNEEVLYEDEQSKLYHVRYQIKDSDDFITIATTRPETILGDSAIAVNPSDERYAHLEGKSAIVPLVNREVPIIKDRYVEADFGTGALKVTPAHDANDYAIGKRHKLETIDILNNDGTLSQEAQFFIGEDRFKARKLIAKELEEMGALIQVEDYMNKVGRSERTKAIIEPRLSLQWYVDMKELSEPALKAVLDDVVKIFPSHFKNTYKHWMENIQDWCISRQLWWGHRIPAWYLDEEVFVAKTGAEALEMARTKLNDETIQLKDLKQDEDVLDTWFSSWLWPISVFDGFKDQKELDYYYPTQVLVTGWEIIFLWVARMIISGYEYKNEHPFDAVYFTGIVRDKQRRKMSKSLGNSPDPIELIDTYGADGIRFGIMSCSPAGGDILFDVKMVEQGRNFSNKIWNALRLIKSWERNDDLAATEEDNLAQAWLLERFKETAFEVNQHFDGYKLSEAIMSSYRFIWDDFCSWYLEMIKPPYGEKVSGEVQDNAIEIFELVCRLLHPHMPFITEEVWHLLKERPQGDDCILASWPEGKERGEKDKLQLVDWAQQLITGIRDVRQKEQLPQKQLLQLQYFNSEEAQRVFDYPGLRGIIMKLAYVDQIQVTTEEPGQCVSFRTGKTELFIPLEKEIDVEAEAAKLEEELTYARGFVQMVEKKLANSNFVDNAPEAVVNKERQKLADGQEKVSLLEESLKRLNKA